MHLGAVAFRLGHVLFNELIDEKGVIFTVRTNGSDSRSKL